MTDSLLFSGASCAAVTPFSGGSPDLDSFGRVLDRIVSGGIKTVVVCGTTGESSTLTDPEQQKVISFAVHRLEGKAKVLSGASSNSTLHAARRCAAAISLGAEGVLAVTPYYNKASDDGMVAHYKAVAESAAEASAKAGKAPAGVILYNVPSRTGSSLNMNILERLAPVKNIVGIKEASGSVRFASEIISRFKDRYAVYSGCDELTLPILACGGAGCVSVTANVMPREVNELCRAFFEGDTARAASISDMLRPYTDALFSEVNPIPVKAVLSDMGLCREEYRLPLCPMTGEKREALRRLFAERMGDR